jgi:hypothetical protein
MSQHFVLLIRLLIVSYLKNADRVLQAEKTQLLAAGAIYMFEVFYLQVKCDIAIMAQ